jgi:hypothetical protein
MRSCSICLSLHDLFHLKYILQIHSCYHTWQNFLCKGRIVFCNECLPHFLYLLIYWWAFWLIPYHNYCE